MYVIDHFTQEYDGTVFDWYELTWENDPVDEYLDAEQTQITTLDPRDVPAEILSGILKEELAGMNYHSEAEMLGGVEQVIRSLLGESDYQLFLAEVARRGGYQRLSNGVD